MEKKPDGRKNNGGHAGVGKKKLNPVKKKHGIAIYLSEEQFLGDWKTEVCSQFEKKFKDKLKSICNLNK